MKSNNTISLPLESPCTYGHCGATRFHLSAPSSGGGVAWHLYLLDLEPHWQPSRRYIPSYTVFNRFYPKASGTPASVVWEGGTFKGWWCSMLFIRFSLSEMSETAWDPIIGDESNILSSKMLLPIALLVVFTWESMRTIIKISSF